jgi:cytoskeletal protein RodZ
MNPPGTPIPWSQRQQVRAPSQPLFAMPAEYDLDWGAIGFQLGAARDRQDQPPEYFAHLLCLSKKQILAMECGDVTPFPATSALAWSIRRYANLLGLDEANLLKQDRATEPATTTDDLFEAPNNTPMDAEVAVETDVITLPEKQLRPSRNFIPSARAVLWVGLASLAGFVALQTPQSARIQKLPAVTEYTAITGPATGASVSAADTPLAPAAFANPAIVSDAVVIAIQGLDAAIPGEYFYVESRAPLVIKKKAVDTPHMITTAEFPQGITQRMPVRSDELIQIAGENNIDLYYQKRKIQPDQYAAGQWLRFIKKTQ